MKKLPKFVAHYTRTVNGRTFHNTLTLYVKDAEEARKAAIRFMEGPFFRRDVLPTAFKIEKIEMAS